jgi:iron complex transport system substrate-binding protein
MARVLSRRDFLYITGYGFIGTLGMSALSGCSNTPENVENEGPNTSGEKGTEAAFPRTYRDNINREVVIEAQPQRAVVLHFGFAEYLLALGISPVGVAWLYRAQSFKTLEPYSSELDKAVELGDVMAPDLERILSLNPDLIIADSSIHADALDALQNIAPTVFKKTYGTWQETLNDYAQMLGCEAEAESYITSTQNLMDETRAKLNKYKGQTFMFLRPTGKSMFGVSEYPPQSFHYDAETGFGLTPPEGIPNQWEDITLEALAAFNPDYLFFQDDADTNRQAIEDIESSGVWQSISAVRQGHVGELDLSVNTGSPLAIRLAAQQLQEQLEKWA